LKKKKFFREIRAKMEQQQNGQRQKGPQQNGRCQSGRAKKTCIYIIIFLIFAL